MTSSFGSMLYIAGILHLADPGTAGADTETPNPGGTASAAGTQGSGDEGTDPDAAVGGAVAPVLSVSGSTSGDAEAKVGVAWFVPGKKVVHTPTLTFGVDIDDGLGKLFTFTKEDGPAVPNAWSLALSYGVILRHDSDDLVPDGMYPGELGIEEAKVAFGTCMEVCKGRKEGGCAEFLAAVENEKQEVRKDTRGVRLQKSWSDLDATNVAEIRAQVDQSIPSPHPQCQTSRKEVKLQVTSLFSGAADSELEGSWSVLAEAVEKAAVKCAGECTDRGDSGLECRSTAKFATELLSTEDVQVSAEVFDQTELCAAGEKQLADATKRVTHLRRVASARYPKVQASIGGSAGFSPHKFLRVDEDYQPLDDDGEPFGSPYTRLRDKADTRLALSTGFSVAYIHVPSPSPELTALGFTVEVLFRYSYGSKDSSTSVRWCEEKAGVVGEEPDGPTPTECTTRAYGHPRRENAVLSELYLGWVETNRGFFRVAAGVRHGYRADANLSELTNGTHELTMRAPLSFNLTAAPRRAGKLDYDGVFRLDPFVGFTKSMNRDGDAELGPVVGLNFVLLGKRSLFSTRFDQL